ncbi:MAG: hypothetical protein GXX85_03645 [Ignavibacteria bacterium]|nr:hypothetical protein [Ignavibacteria bacterium]
MIFIFLTISAFSQSTGFVEYDHPINKYFQRMNLIGVLDDFDSHQIPLSFRAVSKYLSEIEKNSDILNTEDKEFLLEYLSEFSFIIKRDFIEYLSLVKKPAVNSLFSEKERFLHYEADSTGNGIFMNLLFDVAYSGEKHFDNKSGNVFSAKWGGKITGTYKDNFGFSFKATNGTSFGNKYVLLRNPAYATNYKFNEVTNNSGSNYFDETEGYAAFSNDNISIKIGRDKNHLGYGNVKTILGSSSLPMDYIGMNFIYSFFSFSYLHGKLLGSYNSSYDSLQGSIASVNEKYFAYHRFGFNLYKNVNLGIGESIIYSRRSMDISYLNPFNFYKSVEHDNRDRDNSVLFIDLKADIFKNFSLFAEYLIDDMDFSKIGTGWYGNKTLFNAGFRTIPFYKSFPADITFQMIRIEPYVYAHRITDNNYTNFGLSLVHPLQPNSINYSINMYYPLSQKLNFEADFLYSIHGNNIYNEQGGLANNFGGNINNGHRPGDSEKVNFLDGIKTHSAFISFKASYQPLRNYFCNFKIEYLRNEQKQKFIFTDLELKVKI